MLVCRPLSNTCGLYFNVNSFHCILLRLTSIVKGTKKKPRGRLIKLYTTKKQNFTNIYVEHNIFDIVSSKKEELSLLLPGMLCQSLGHSTKAIAARNLNFGSSVQKCLVNKPEYFISQSGDILYQNQGT